MKKYIVAVMCALALIGCGSVGSVVAERTDGGESGMDAGVPETSFETSYYPPQDAGVDWDGNLTSGLFDLWTPETDPMIYQGGSVMTSPINVYAIWYGSWTGAPNRQTILENFLSNVSSTNWFQVNDAYYQQAGVTYDAGNNGGISQRPMVHRSNKNLTLDGGLPEAGMSADAGLGPKVYVDGGVSLVKSVNVGYTYGKSINDDDVLSIIKDAITAHQLPLDPNGAYFVFPSADVSEGSIYGDFCYDYCGWHNNATVSGTDIKYVYVGDPTPCLDLCTVMDTYQKFGFSQSPNGDWAGDGMVSVVGHELSELTTDPDPSTNIAWTDDLGEETGDKCAWTFGSLYRTSNSVANVHVGSNDYLIQQLWVLDNDGGRCDLHQ